VHRGDHRVKLQTIRGSDRKKSVDEQECTWKRRERNDNLVENVAAAFNCIVLDPRPRITVSINARVTVKMVRDSGKGRFLITVRNCCGHNWLSISVYFTRHVLLLNERYLLAPMRTGQVHSGAVVQFDQFQIALNMAIEDRSSTLEPAIEVFNFNHFI
jgi:hypothetical protein